MPAGMSNRISENDSGERDRQLPEGAARCIDCEEGWT